MKTKLIMLSVLGAASLGLTQAANAGWEGGACGGPGVCIEYTDTNSGVWRYDTDSAPTFKGPFITPPVPVNGVYSSSPMENFVFSGPTDLSCFDGDVVLECDLTLEGKVKQDGNIVNIEVVAGGASGGGLCGLVNIGDFNWYIGENSEHSSWGPSGGFAITGPGPYFGSVGSIGFTVGLPPFYIVNISDSHIHDVTFDNNGSGPSYFDFDNLIVENDTDDPTGCAIDGTLYVQGGNDVDIVYQ